MTLSPWKIYAGVNIFKVNQTVYTYKTSDIALDADGSPRAYGPGNIGLDDNRNAGYPNKGWRSVLAVDPRDAAVPYVQTDGDRRGYFVSKTSLFDRRPAVLEIDPAKYVDAETFPYIVFPGAFMAMGGTGNWGDVVMARCLANGNQSVALVADGGPTKAPLGEISLKLAAALGGRNPNPRTGKGAPPGPIQYLVFPGSRSTPAWPRSLDDVSRQGDDLLNAVGGWPDL